MHFTALLGQVARPALGTVCLASAALAEPTAPAPPSAAASTAATTTVAADTSGEIQEIIVTAQRRPEDVQKSSLAIQVIGGDALAKAGVQDVKDLSALVPGLQIALGANETQAFIRGVGDESSTGLGQSAVAFNIDGVYAADQASYAPLFYDVSRVEVLKGPQGTLYGRNSSAGAVNIITNKPTDALSGDITVEYGNYDLKHVTGAINVPITDTLWVRGAFNYIDRAGYLEDRTDDDQQQGGRVELMWKPNEAFSALIIGDYEHVGGYGGGQVLLPTQPGTERYSGATNPINNAAISADAGPLAPLLALPGSGPHPLPGAPNELLTDSNRSNTQRNLSGEFNYDLDFATLTFLPAYRTTDDHYFGYTPGFPFGDDETTRTQSYELRLARTTDVYKVTGGIYYFDEINDIEQFAVISPIISPLNSEITPDLATKSYAGFAQTAFNVTDAFRLIGGLRYTHEHKTMNGRRILYGVTSPGTTDIEGATNFDFVTFRAGAEYDLTGTNMLYATVSRGEKSGGFNTFTSANGISNVYDPEKLTSYEFGARNRFFDNRFQANIEGFYWDYKNSQQSHLTYDPYGNLQFETLNAASAAIFGTDIDLLARVTPADTVNLTAEYMDSYFKKFDYQIPTANYSPGTVGCLVGASATPGFTTINCSNQPLPRSARWSGNGGYQHTFTFPDDSSVNAAVNFDFQGRRYIAVDYIPTESVASDVRMNLSLGYETADKIWSVTGYVKNVTDRVVYLGSVNAAVAPGFIYATVDAPRTFGVRVTAKFGK